MRKETLSVRFLYQTKIGRCVLKLLVQPWVSKIAGAYLESRFSHWIINMYVKRNKIDMSMYPSRTYRSFNAFFTRKRKEGTIDITRSHLISPCDAYLTVYPIDENSVYHIKHCDYRLAQLLDSSELARQYAGGLCLMFRLTTRHYHRYCYLCNGAVERIKRIDGKLHCVRPVAYDFVLVFVENSREYTVVRSEEWGTVVQMEVGALLVGKIKNFPVSAEVFQGMEKGYFEFGGSTIIVLLEKDQVRMDASILERSRQGLETEVHLGMKIGAQN